MSGQNSSFNPDTDDCDNTTRITDVTKKLAEKKKDIGLFAHVGQALLTENRELKNRNEFLEEAINALNETIVQLRHELQMRTSLLRMYVENDCDVDISSSGWSNNENLQRKVKRLEDENEYLRNEMKNLKKFVAEVEEKERLKISEWTLQLDNANEKICSLQQSLSEKSEECMIRGAEVERLLREVAARKSREKSHLKEMEELKQELEDAWAVHQELTAQVVSLQERYTEVLSTLRDVEEELRIKRQYQTAHRTNSADSLYDSLASELEASDSGLQTVISSARSEQLKLRNNVQLKIDMKCLRNKLEMIDAQENGASYAATSAATTGDSPAPIRQRHASHSGDDVLDVPNNVLAELIQQSCPFEGSHKSFLCLENKTFSLNGVEQHEAPVTTTNVSIKSSNISTGVPQCATTFIRGINGVAGLSSSSSSTLSKTASSESLTGYEGPKMGEPGRPGTRDLDWTIRKLNIRRQVERDYAKFRRERGLPPNVSFFDIPSIKKIWNEKSYHSKQTMQQILQSSSSVAEMLQKQIIVKNDLAKAFKPWKTLSNIGLVSAIYDSLNQGVLMRSVKPFTSPTTPVRQKRKSLSCDTLEKEQSPPCLSEALGLNIPSLKMSLSSSTPKRLARSMSTK